jgi:hypothetical protein
MKKDNYAVKINYCQNIRVNFITEIFSDRDAIFLNAPEHRIGSHSYTSRNLELVLLFKGSY